MSTYERTSADGRVVYRYNPAKGEFSLILPTGGMLTLPCFEAKRLQLFLAEPEIIASIDKHIAALSAWEREAAGLPK